jgi:SAM-dependent methyltransferase
VTANKTTFDELLNVFWLRPETALWRQLDINAMGTFEFKSPSLDLGCGDGIFSFVRAGGGFDLNFDAFQSMAGLENFFDNIDVFDAFDNSLNPAITNLPKYRIDVGFDHKENLLKKSGRLGLYSELKCGDANNSLPFENESFNSVFSNIVYWLDKPEAVLLEINRILRPGGRLCLMLPNQTLPDFSFYNQLYVKTGNEKWRFLERLDRGRFSDNIRQARSDDEWQSVFRDAGLHVVEHKAHLSKTVIQLWDIGLRPLFPVLKKMAGMLPPENLSDIKQEWVAVLRQFLQPLMEMDAELGQGVEPAFHCYILEK